MKKMSSVWIIVLSVVLTTVGALMKIMHFRGADFFLGIGTIMLFVGLAVIVIKYLRRSTRRSY